MNVKIRMANCSCTVLSDDKITGTDGDFTIYTISSTSQLTFKANEGFHFLNIVGGAKHFVDFESEIIAIYNFDYPAASYTLTELSDYTEIRLIAFKNDITKVKEYQAEVQGCKSEDISDDTLLYINEMDRKYYGVNANATEFIFKTLEGLQFIEGVIGTGDLKSGSTVEFKISNGDYTTFTLNSPLDYSSITITGTKQAEAIVNTNIFLVNDDIISKLYKSRFIDVHDNAGNIIKTDLGVYILKLYNVYLPIQSDDLTAELNIPLGYYNTDIKAPALKKTNMIFNFGSITINGKYNNVYDFKDTDIIIKLPFITDFVNIEPCYIINQTIEIFYDVDFYSGTANIIIKSSFNQGSVIIINKKICGEIPYILLNSTNTDYNQVQKNITQVEINVIRNIPITTNNIFGKENNSYSKIVDYTGYIEVENILFKSQNANEDEKTQIENLLKEGVYINDKN